jgi:hypothetical protein
MNKTKKFNYPKTVFATVEEYDEGKLYLSFNEDESTLCKDGQEVAVYQFVGTKTVSIKRELK